VIDDRNAFLERFERLAHVAALVKLSVRDIAWLYPDLAEHDAAARLLEIGADCVALTHGRDGAGAWTEAGSAQVSAPGVTVVDTVGAGDAFGAGLLAWLWRHDRLSRTSLRRLDRPELEDALAYAVAVAAAQCSRASAWGPTAADVDRVPRENGGLARVR
jgi:fructokinase